MTTGILLETMDGLIDLARVDWQQVAPCGCVAGLTVGSIGNTAYCVTAEQAAENFSGTVAARKRAAEQGWTYRPRERGAAIDDFRKPCPHNPAWGVPPIPTPAGHVWATHRDVRVRHLVPASAVETFTENHPALCGSRASVYGWSNHPWNLDGKVECKRCLAKAAKAVAL